VGVGVGVPVFVGVGVALEGHIPYTEMLEPVVQPEGQVLSTS
jgi:hypothetical protein